MSYAPEIARIATPIGIITLCGNGDRLSTISIDSAAADALVPPVSPLLTEAVAQLNAYFDGTLRVFDLPLAPAATDRGEALRKGMVEIGFGTTRTYGALSKILGSSPRAIGQACARNPYPIVVPCHRVLAAGDKLGAYSAGAGPVTKAYLLNHEYSLSAKGDLWAR